MTNFEKYFGNSGIAAAFIKTVLSCHDNADETLTCNDCPLNEFCSTPIEIFNFLEMEADKLRTNIRTEEKHWFEDAEKELSNQWKEIAKKIVREAFQKAKQEEEE